jgi:cyclic-di-GMP phosphodiesterase TipF (flagellum assembly factor)
MRKQDKSKPSASRAAPAEPAPDNGPAREAAPSTAPRDGLVLLCIVVVAAAFATMLYTQFRVTLSASVAYGVGIWAVCMLIHKLAQKSAQIAHLKAEIARQRAASGGHADAMRTMPASGPELGRHAASAPRAEEGPGPVRPERSVRETVTQSAGPRERTAPQKPVAANDTASAPKAASSSADDLLNLHLRPLPESRKAAGAAAGESPAFESDAMRERWTFRPREPQGTTPGAPDGAAHSFGIGVTRTVEGDLELVQRKIKELADELNSPDLPRLTMPPLADKPAKAKADALETSIGALRAAASNMREPSFGGLAPTLKIPDAEAPPRAQAFGDLQIPSTAKRIAGPEAAPTTPSDEQPSLELRLPELPSLDLPATPERKPVPSPRIDAIANAIDADAMDVLLGPIVMLSTHSVSHYEMAAHLKARDGARLVMTDDDLASLSGDAAARLDVARLRRCAALSLRMEAREKEGTLLTEFAGSSLTNRQFLETFARIYEERPKIADQLVLTFSQRAVDTMTPAAWKALRDMHAFGFRFALDKVSHMRSELTALAQSGLSFVKLEAPVLLDGFAAPDRFVSASEIIQRAALAGLSVVATGITDAKTRARLFEAGILLGQGPLFGTPRQVNIDNAGAQKRPAAA